MGINCSRPLLLFFLMRFLDFKDSLRDIKGIFIGSQTSWIFFSDNYVNGLSKSFESRKCARSFIFCLLVIILSEDEKGILRRPSVLQGKGKMYSFEKNGGS